MSNMDLSGFLKNAMLGKGDKEAKPIENYGSERIWLILRQHYGKLIGLNLLFIVCCIPIITIPAAVAGLNRAILNWVRSRNQPVLSSFFNEFKTDFFKRTCIGLLLLIAPFSMSYYPKLMNMPILSATVFVIASVLYFCFTSYYYPLLVLLDVPIGKNLKNAVVLMTQYWHETLIMLTTAGLFYVLLILFPLYTAPLFVIIMFAFSNLICCSYFNKAFKECFENKKQTGLDLEDIE